MAEKLPVQLSSLFADGGELIRKASLVEPKEEVHTLAMDNPFVEVREDSFQVKALKDDTFEVHGVFVDGAQIWRHPQALIDAENNVTSIYALEPGPTRLLRGLFDRQLAVKYGLRQDVANHGIRTRIKTNPEGEILDYQTDIVKVRVNAMTHRQCGKLILSRTHGRVVRDATASVMQHFGFEHEYQLEKYEGEPSALAYERISLLAQNAFANLVNATFAQEAQQERRPWIYKATHPKTPDPISGIPTSRSFYTDKPIHHMHVDGLYCKISPAFREFVALTTQSLARFYLAGGSPDDVNQEVLRSLVEKINTGYSEVTEVQANLEQERLLAA